jgi:hypothetical protein
MVAPEPYTCRVLTQLFFQNSAYYIPVPLVHRDNLLDSFVAFGLVAHCTAEFSVEEDC